MKLVKIFARISCYKHTPKILIAISFVCILADHCLDIIWFGRIGFAFLMWALYSSVKASESN